MFKENFIRICADRGVAPSAVCKAIGLSNAAYSQWTNETIPRKTTLLKIADYFGVSVDTLLAENESGADEITTESNNTPPFISYKSDSIENVAELLKRFEGRGIILVPDENKKSPSGEELSKDEKTLLEAFRRVPEDQKDHVIDLVRTALKMQGLL